METRATDMGPYRAVGNVVWQETSPGVEHFMCEERNERLAELAARALNRNARKRLARRNGETT